MQGKRRQRLKEGLAANNMAAIAVNAGPSLTYLTGLHFHLMERPVVFVYPVTGRPVIVLPELEKAKLHALNFEVDVYTYGESPVVWQDVFCKALQGRSLSGKRVGVEPRQLRLLEYDYLRRAVRDIACVDGSALFGALRSVKDGEEISLMRKAVAIAEAALEATLPRVKVGVTEREIAAELMLQLMRCGSDTALPFSPIVAAGPNAANPHAQPGETRLAPGDLLIVDWGAYYRGYASDLTRTFGISRVDAQSAQIYAAVKAANSAGLAAGRPGGKCSAIDRAARKCIEEAGFGDFFTHRTGHGIGMECHEEPYIRDDNDQLLAEGMTYTVEPGIYLPGQNGVRIEDDVLVTATGAESLSTMSRELRILD